MLLFVVELIGEFGVITARLRPRGRSSRRSSKQADLGVLTTDVGDRFGLDMRKTSEWSGAV